MALWVIIYQITPPLGNRFREVEEKGQGGAGKVGKEA
jgi:hypothetical protein